MCLSAEARLKCAFVLYEAGMLDAFNVFDKQLMLANISEFIYIQPVNNIYLLTFISTGQRGGIKCDSADHGIAIHRF